MTKIKTVKFQHRTFMYIQKKFLFWNYWWPLAEGGDLLKQERGDYIETKIMIYE